MCGCMLGATKKKRARMMVAACRSWGRRWRLYRLVRRSRGSNGWLVKAVVWLEAEAHKHDG